MHSQVTITNACCINSFIVLRGISPLKVLFSYVNICKQYIATCYICVIISHELHGMFYMCVTSEFGNLCNKCPKWLIEQNSSYSDYFNVASGFTSNSRAPGDPSQSSCSNVCPSSATEFWLMRRQSSCLVSLYLHALHFSDYRHLQQIIFDFNMTISLEILCLESNIISKNYKA